MTITKAAYVLSLLEELSPETIQHMSYAGAGAMGGLTAMQIRSGVKHSKEMTRSKIHQAGLGDEHTKAKEQLSSMRKKHMRTLGSNSGLGLRITAQKRKIQDIENRGLERYHKGLIQHE